MVITTSKKSHPTVRLVDEGRSDGGGEGGIRRRVEPHRPARTVHRGDHSGEDVGVCVARKEI